MRNDTPVINEEMCCWTYTINPSESHRPMVIWVRSGTPVMFMSMAPIERRECVPTSYRVNPSLATPTHLHSALMTEMLFEAMTKQRTSEVG